MNKWIIGVCLISLFASCSKDSDETQPSNNPTNGGTGISFSPNVSASTIVEIDGPSTRAPLINFNHNDKVGLFGIPTIGGGTQGGHNLFECKNEADFQKNLFNAPYTYVQDYDVLQTDYPATFPNGNDPALQLYGYYPYSADVEYTNVNNVPQWAVPWKLNIDDMSQTIDYMYVEPQLAVYNKVGLEPVALLFQHAMGRLDLRFYSTNKQIALAGYIVKNVTVKCKTGQRGWMAITDGELSFNADFLTCKYPVSGNIGIAYPTPGISAASFMFPPNAIIQEITCDLVDTGAKTHNYVIYSGGYDIPITKGKMTDMRVNFLPKDASYSSNVDTWTRTTVDVNVKIQQ